MYAIADYLWIGSDERSKDPVARDLGLTMETATTRIAEREKASAWFGVLLNKSSTIEHC
jgi:hypothetical protein